jgi:regulator of protease activity HflC (stomatin/prohibitin superfamily)
METIRWMSVIIIMGLLGITFLGLAIKIVRQYERGVVLRFGRLIRTRAPGFNLIIRMFERNKALRDLNFENSDSFRISPRWTLRPKFGFRIFPTPKTCLASTMKVRRSRR